MEPSALAYYTTQELIAELMHRKTFVGVVVHAQEELRAKQWAGEGILKVHYNANLGGPEVGRLLDVVAQHVERQSE